MLAQNGTSHSTATEVIDPPKKEQSPTKTQTKAQTLEKVTIPALQEKLKEAQRELKQLKKPTLS